MREAQIGVDCPSIIMLIDFRRVFSGVTTRLLLSIGSTMRGEFNSSCASDGRDDDAVIPTKAIKVLEKNDINVLFTLTLLGKNLRVLRLW